MTIRSVEPILRATILRAAKANARARGIRTSQVSRSAYGDSKFFDNLSRKRVSFTVEKFDQIMRWFADPANWPDGKIPAAVLSDPFSNKGASDGEKHKG